MIICITGTPGTGKTTLAKELATEYSGTYTDGNDIIKKYDLVEEFDEEKDCQVIDADAFSEAVQKEIQTIKTEKDTAEEFVVIDSHMSHVAPKEIVSLCIVCRCDLKELQKRLAERNYSEKKVKENLDAEIFESCLTEAKEQEHDVYEYYTDKEATTEKERLRKRIQELRN